MTKIIHPAYETTEYFEGDLVEWTLPRQLHISTSSPYPPVKGKVTAVFDDVFGWAVTFKVTSLYHPLYQVGTELCVEMESRRLKKRTRNVRSQVQPA